MAFDENQNWINIHYHMFGVKWLKFQIWGQITVIKCILKDEPNWSIAGQRFNQDQCGKVILGQIEFKKSSLRLNLLNMIKKYAILIELKALNFQVEIILELRWTFVSFIELFNSSTAIFWENFFRLWSSVSILNISPLIYLLFSVCFLHEYAFCHMVFIMHDEMNKIISHFCSM